MRGRLVTLTLALIVALSPVARGALEVKEQLGQDLCINPGAIDDDPTLVVEVNGQCTDTETFASVEVVRMEDGAVVVTIVIIVAENGHTFVVECGHPDHLLPTLGFPGKGGNEWYGPCWRHPWWA